MSMIKDLFDQFDDTKMSTSSGLLKIPDGSVVFHPTFFSQTQSDYFYENLLRDIEWKQDQIKYFGTLIDLPRLTAWYGDPGVSYTYSGIHVKSIPWTALLLKIKKSIESFSGNVFNSVLLNLYRNGRDGVAWHSDDEPELGVNPTIGSVSFGATRQFQLKHKERPQHRVKLNLTHGSYLLMSGVTQHKWVHQIPKTSRACKSRINLTFRMVHPHHDL